MQRRAMTLLVSLLFAGAASPLFAQYADAPTWGDISAEELSMTVYEPDSAATAVVLYDYGVQELNQTGEGALGALYVYQRIKILDRSAADALGNVSVHFVHQERQESLAALKAQTTLPDGTVIKLKKKDFFIQDVDMQSEGLERKVDILQGAQQSKQSQAYLGYRQLVRERDELQNHLSQTEVEFKGARQRLAQENEMLERHSH